MPFGDDGTRSVQSTYVGGAYLDETFVGCTCKRRVEERDGRSERV
eukprot:CAMPEP_0195533700 /NCGR_PEP_ID=MMETSP0794_2-20130614/41020_1 /TAXON_ID=515487 /ORGANISM="Stephanopyxis turris, Strain CCMP 815" /LENGTH=44 /DNA_ID= /DNA_START= /DNA_END= /DNA_ORIENTATION=